MHQQLWNNNNSKDIRWRKLNTVWETHYTLVDKLKTIAFQLQIDAIHSLLNFHCEFREKLIVFTLKYQRKRSRRKIIFVCNIFKFRRLIKKIILELEVSRRMTIDEKFLETNIAFRIIKIHFKYSFKMISLINVKTFFSH